MLLLLATSLMSTASAQTRTPGVKVGDNFKYTFDFNMYSTNSSFLGNSLSGLVQGLLDQVKNIDSAQVSITDVSGVKVTAQVTIQFKNGTQQSSTSTVDIATGQTSDEEMGSVGTFLIAANLRAGDQIYSSGSAGTINETITRNYPSGARQENHQSIVMNYDVPDFELGSSMGETFQQSNVEDRFWDQQTGVLTDMSYNMTTRSQILNADISMHVHLVESSVFTIPEYPILAIVFVALATSTALAFKVRRQKNT